MGTPTLTSMKVFILAAMVAVSAARPRFLVIPIEDVDFEGSMGQLPVYRMPQLARQARMAQEEQEPFQSGPYEAQSSRLQARMAQEEQEPFQSGPYKAQSSRLQARMAQEEQESFQSGPYEEQDQYPQSERRDSAQSSSNAPAAHAGPDHVDYGAYTGGYGAFGWYTDHPVLLT